MKSLLRGDRATSAVPMSLAARLHAWAKESLAARSLAVLAGLVVLAVIGRSALAGSIHGPEVPSPATSVSVEPVLTAAPVDAGARASVPAIPTVSVDELPASPSRDAPVGDAKPRATPDDPVDLNSATLDDLRRLPGVGAKRAEAILALRGHLPGGRFRQIEDLLRVKGIGRAMLKRLHSLVRLTP
jgi:competence protein ComEA